MCYIVFISHGFHWRSIKVTSFEYVITIIKTNVKIYILIKMSNWDLKRVPDPLKKQKVHFNSGPSDDVQLTLDALYQNRPYF